MARIVITEPTKARFEGLTDMEVSQLRDLLVYEDQKVFYEYKKFKHAVWYADKHGAAAYYERLEALKRDIKKCLFFQDEIGYWTWSGLAEQCSKWLGGCAVIRKLAYPAPGALGWDNKPPFTMYPYQEQALDKLLEIKHGGVEIGCHARGERVLMYDGTLRAVEDVVVGDLLMGPDSQPRCVEELRRGRDTMYEIETVNGQKMKVNGNHILALRRTNRSNKRPADGKPRRANYRGENPVVFITVNDYLGTSARYKHLHKLYSVGVDFQEKNLPIDPYFLGLLLGDGCLSGTPSITTADAEVVEKIRQHAERLALKVTKHEKAGNAASNYALSMPGSSRSTPNRLTNDLRGLGLWDMTSGGKFIPHSYRTASRADRLHLLAGLMDTDGSHTGGCFDYISKSEQLAQDVAFIARSLGLRASLKPCRKTCVNNGVVGTYYRVTLSGDLSVIPTAVARKKVPVRAQKKDCTSFGFKVTKLSDDAEYFGFVLDKDHLYLTDTFLVTHNTGLGKSFIIENLTKELALKTVIMAPSVDIARRLQDDCLSLFGKRKVGFYGDGTKKSDKLVTIGVSHSFTRIEPGTEHWNNLVKAQVFIADESHQCPASTLAKVCFGLMANAPYRAFFSATQFRGDGLDLLLEGITGPLVYKKTVREGIAEGYLSALKFVMIQTESESRFEDGDPNAMTRAHLFYNEKVIRKAADLANKFVEGGRHVLILVEEMEQFARLVPHLKHQVKFAHGGVTKENKEKLPVAYHTSDPSAYVKEFNDLQFPILVGTSCVSTGTDIKANRATINLQGGRSEIGTMQGAVGRSTRLYPRIGKNECVVVDFDVTNIEVTHRHALARKQIYEQVADVKEVAYGR